MVGREESFELIDKVIRISNSTVDVERRLQNILALVRRNMRIDQVLLFNLDRENRSLSLRTTGSEGETERVSLEGGEHFLWRTVQQRESLHVGPEDVAELPSHVRAYFQYYSGFDSFPVMDDQVLYGILVLCFKEGNEIDPDWVPHVEAVTREMAGTIRNSRLYIESKKRIAELSVLYELGRAVNSTLELETILNTVVTITCKVLLAEGCSLNVVDTAADELRVGAEYGLIPTGCSFKKLLERREDAKVPPEIMACISRKEPYIGSIGGDWGCPGMSDDARNIQSMICLPIRFKGHFKGTLSVFNKLVAPTEIVGDFKREDLELLSTMGAMISSSLENALTFQDVGELARRNERLVKNLSCLYEISGAMMTTIKMDELLSIIMGALTMNQGLGFDRALILLVDEEGSDLIGTAMKEMRPEDRKWSDLPLSEQLKVVASLDSSEPNGRLHDLRLSLGESKSVLTSTARNQKAVIMKPSTDGSSDHGLPFEFGSLSYAAVPMAAKGKIVGVIVVDRDFSGNDISDEDIRNLSMLANQAGLAIENSRLYEHIEQTNLALGQTRERLLEAEKLAALGEMAAGMAHEIRNPLVSIGGFTRRLLKNMDPDSPHRVYVEVIINEVTRLEKTLSEVLDFSRDTLGHLAEYDLNEVVADALYVLRREFRERNIEVIKDLGEVMPVMVDERQIKHVFFNLFFNATQAMENGGVLKVSTYPTRVDDRAFTACEVTDSGPGIPPEILSNVFNPFFTTKDSGTGLGLSIVHKIVTRHHGEIDVVNRAEGGASFIVKLPVAAEAGLYLK